MIIRTIKGSDIKDIHRITEEGAPYIAIYPDYVYWIFENLYSEMCFIAEDEGEVRGFVNCMPVPAYNAIFVWQLGVTKEYRKKGVAYQLLKAAWDYAEAHDMTGIVTSICAENSASLNSFGKIAAEHELVCEKIGVYEWQGVLNEDVYLWHKR